MANLALTTAGKLRVVRSDEQFTGIAGVAITIGQVVRIDVATGRFALALGTTAPNARALGIALKTSAAGEAVTVLRRGILDGFALSALAYDQAVFVSDTGGAVGDVAGTVSVNLGRVVPGFAQTIGVAADKLLLAEFTS